MSELHPVCISSEDEEERQRYLEQQRRSRKLRKKKKKCCNQIICFHDPSVKMEEVSVATGKHSFVLFFCLSSVIVLM